jgi:hypothetical protein
VCWSGTKLSKSFYDNSRPYEISGGIFNWNVDDVERANLLMEYSLLFSYYNKLMCSWLKCREEGINNTNVHGMALKI